MYLFAIHKEILLFFTSVFSSIIMKAVYVQIGGNFMNLLTLYYFVELARELHVTNTAQKLYISQQNLSQHIQRLEQYYGCLLYTSRCV